MAYCHIAHDCEVQDNVIMANSATLGGHVVIEQNVFIGGLAAVQQWCRVGAYAMVGGLSGVNKDVPPFTRGAGHHIELKGINTISLKRNNFSDSDINLIKKVYRTLFGGRKPLREALEEVATLYGDNPYVRYLVNFIRTSLESGRDIATDKTLRRVLTKKEHTPDGK